MRVSLTTFVVHLLTRGHDIANHCSPVQWLVFQATDIQDIFQRKFMTFMLPSSRFPHLSHNKLYILQSSFLYNLLHSVPNRSHLLHITDVQQSIIGPTIGSSACKFPHVLAVIPERFRENSDQTTILSFSHIHFNLSFSIIHWIYEEK